MKLFDRSISGIIRSEFFLCIIGAGLLHFYYVFLFVFYGIPYMAIINIASLFLYVVLACSITPKRYVFIELCICAEVIWHVILATTVLGWDYGFQLALIAIIPITVFASTIAFWISTMISVVAVATFVLLKLYSEPTAVQSIDMLFFSQTAIYLINTISCLVLLIVLARVLLYEKYSYQKLFDTENKKLRLMATVDPLTGLRNRRYMYDKLEAAVAQREEQGKRFYVTIADIDDFKKINDTFGHDCGDEVLRMVSEILCANSDSNDIISRWGGEEFLILSYFDEDEKALAHIETMRNAISSTEYQYDGNDVHFSMTFGLCGDALDSNQMLKIADEYLYIGKRSGKNVVIDTPVAVR